MRANPWYLSRYPIWKIPIWYDSAIRYLEPWTFHSAFPENHREYSRVHGGYSQNRNWNQTAPKLESVYPGPVPVPHMPGTASFGTGNETAGSGAGVRSSKRFLINFLRSLWWLESLMMVRPVCLGSSIIQWQYKERMFLILNFDYATQSLPVPHILLVVSQNSPKLQQFHSIREKHHHELDVSKYMFKEGSLPWIVWT